VCDIANGIHERVELETEPKPVRRGEPVESSDRGIREFGPLIPRDLPP